MAKAKARAGKKEEKKSLFGRMADGIVRYFKGTRTELRKVTWPTREEATNLTLIVLGVTIGMAALLGLLDFVFNTLVSGLLKQELLFTGVLVLIGIIIGGAFIFNARTD